MLSFTDPAIVLSMFMLSFTDPAIVLSMFMLSFTDPAIVLSMCMLSFIFVIVCGHFEWMWICVSFLLFVYICVGYPIKKRGENPINQFNLTTLVCLSQARTWNSIVIEVFFMFNDLMLEAIVCFGIAEHHWFKFLFTI
jgi:hypothetical protein